MKGNCSFYILCEISSLRLYLMCFLNDISAKVPSPKVYVDHLKKSYVTSEYRVSSKAFVGNKLVGRYSNHTCFNY